MEIRQKRWRLLAAAMLLALCSGIGYSWSVFQKPLMDLFGWELKSISLTFTLQVLVSTIAPVFLSSIHRKLGTKRYLQLGILVYVSGLAAARFTATIGYFYLFYGVVVGLGLAMLYPTLIAYATKLFPDKVGMASGLLACSYGSGAILWAPISTQLMAQTGVLSVYLILAVIFCAVMLPVSLLVRNIPQDYGSLFAQKTSAQARQNAGRDYTRKEMLKSPVYYILLLTLTLGTMSGLMIAGHASGMVQEILKYSAQRAAVIVGLFAVFNALGRLAFGFLSDRLGRYPVMILLFIAVGGAMLVMSAFNNGLFLAALLLVSACYGGFTAMFSPACADHFGIRHLSDNYPLLYLAYGFAGYIGPQLVAHFQASGGGYHSAFTVVAVFSAIGIAFVLLLMFLRFQQDKKKFS